MEKFTKFLIEEFTKKQKLANAKAVMVCAKDDGQLLNIHGDEIFYYLGYRQAIKDVIAGLSGNPYNFTEFEEANITLDEIK